MLVPAGLEEVDNVLEGELEALAAVLGAALDGLLGEQALLVLQVDDALLDCVGDCEPVNGDVDGLREAMDAVDGLLLDKLQYLLASLFSSKFTTPEHV